ncbi:hypothetical protein IFU39_00020 [Paenibacillus sp. CFBP 13594]|uniref:hypothetical protein n=1 Tax=Paenibacillus sp. CFBP 13594 TaxID=2774037 RepID=UPI00177D184F|nr:hypothetical protein [Paenibacillus sp. CFBP 13594]MBD8836203.1 hypothetical protein [Paenibacillus sp. CFBP 13594]
MNDIKVLKKVVGDAVITRPIILGKESEEIKDYNKEEPIAIHQAFCDSRYR